MAYSLMWGAVVQHGSHWVVPGDIWGMFRSAHYVGWGDIGDVYAPPTGLVTLPLLAALLAPVAMLSGTLGLTESLPYFIPHPGAWLLLGPAELIIGATVLFPMDALAEHLGLGAGRRRVLCVVEAILVWPTVAMWGHPEDALAVAFAAYGLLATVRGNTRSAGWLWGAAVATQPLVVLVLPVALALTPVRRWAGTALRTALPGITLIVIPLVQEWRQTSRALFQQPNFPSIDHATPWLSLAPVLSPQHRTITDQLARFPVDGTFRYVTTRATGMAGEVVAAGPGRMMAIGLSVVIGVWVYRTRPSLRSAIWAAGLALSLRCVFEAVMNPYYLWPPLALLVLAAAVPPVSAAATPACAGAAPPTHAAASWWRFWAVGADAALLSAYSYHRAGPWLYWVPMVVMLGVAVLLARPGRAGGPDRRPSGTAFGRTARS
jgi:hypothetical protein